MLSGALIVSADDDAAKTAAPHGDDDGAAGGDDDDGAELLFGFLPSPFADKETAKTGASLVIVAFSIYGLAKIAESRRQFPAPKKAAAQFSRLREDAWLEFSKQLEGARTYYFGGILATYEPETVRKLLVLKSHSETRSIIYHFYEWFMPCNDGLLVQDGAKWAAHKRAVMPMFQGGHFDRYARTMNTAVAGVIDAYAKKAASAPATAKGDGAFVIPDMHLAFKQSAVRVLLTWGFGMDPDSDIGRELVAEMMLYLVIAWEDLLDAQQWSTAPQFLYQFWRLKRSGDRIKAIMRRVLSKPGVNYIHDRAARVGGAAAAAAAASKPELARQNMLQAMVDAGLSDDAVANEVNHLHGAHKALAFVQTCTMWELARHPAWVERIREELAKVVHAGRDEDASPCKADLPRLPVCKAVMNEVLRKHVVSFGVVRRTGEPIEIVPGTGKSVPANTDVMVLLHALHHDERLWGKTAHEFDPTRWLNTPPTKEQPIPANAFFPFLDGSRQCLGKALAELEWVCAVHAVLTRFDLRLDGETAEASRIPMRDAMFAAFQGPVPVTFVPRRK